MQAMLEQIAHGTPRRNGHQPPSAKSSLPDPGYYEFARPELLALIPTSARRVLDVGCGAGRLGEALKARQTARQGQELVLGRFTYEHRVRELCEVIGATLERSENPANLSKAR